MEKRGKGRPKVTLTDEQIDQAVAYYGTGLSQDMVADIMGVSTPVLVRECGDRLKRKRALVVDELAKTAVQKALSGNERMLMYALNCLGKWSERQEIDITSGGEPLQIVVTRRTRAQVEPDED